MVQLAEGYPLPLSVGCSSWQVYHGRRLSSATSLIMASLSLLLASLIMASLSLLLGARHSVRPIVTRMLAEAGRLGENLGSESAVRKRVHDELYELPLTYTPYGRLMEQKTLQCESGGTLALEYMNMFALLYLGGGVSDFFTLLKETMTIHGVLRLLFYTDEVVPRNDKRADSGGEFQGIYFSFMDFPQWMHSRQALRWCVFAYVMVADIEEVDTTISNVFREIMHICFSVDSWNLLQTGVRVIHRGEVLHVKCSFEGILQDERGHKYVYNLKGASGTHPCGSCDNCRGRTPWFNDPLSGFAHVLNPDYTQFVRRLRDQVVAYCDEIEEAVANGTVALRETLEKATVLKYEKQGLMWDRHVRQYINFPKCIYWDWQHCWCSSGGVGQYHCNQLLRRICNAIPGFSLDDLDAFAKTVTLPKATTKLSKHFFRYAMVDKDNAHMRCFASEVLTTVVVLGIFIAMVVRPMGILIKECEAFDEMAIVLACFQRKATADCQRAFEATRRHHVLFIELYWECAKPKLHYCMECILSWADHEVLLSCFGAESKHKLGVQIFRFAFNKAHKTALAYEIRRLWTAMNSKETYLHTFLAEPHKPFTASCVLGAWGSVQFRKCSKKLYTPRGLLYKGDLLMWHVQDSARFGQVELFAEVELLSTRVVKFVVIAREFSLEGTVLVPTLNLEIVSTESIGECLSYVREGMVLTPHFVRF